jgi:hypothetical protein
MGKGNVAYPDPHHFAGSDLQHPSGKRMSIRTVIVDYLELLIQFFKLLTNTTSDKIKR